MSTVEGLLKAKFSANCVATKTTVTCKFGPPKSLKTVEFPIKLWSSTISPEQASEIETVITRYSLNYTNDVVGRIQGILQGVPEKKETLSDEELDSWISKSTIDFGDGADGYVLLVGNTRCGKTTLLNSLDGREMRKVAKETVSNEPVLPGDYVLEAVNPVGEIGHEGSKTRDVKVVTIKKVKVADGPGLGDTEGVGEEVGNGLLLAAVAEKLKGILYCIKYDDFRVEAGRKFIEDLGKFQKFLAGNQKKYGRAIRLVITILPEGPAIPVESVKAVIKRFLEDKKLLRDDTSLTQFREWMIKAGLLDRITLSYPLDTAQRDPFLKDIEALTPDPNIPSAPFGVSLSEKTSNQLRALRDARLEVVKQNLENLRKQTKEFWEKKLAEGKAASVAQLEEMIKAIALWSFANLNAFTETACFITNFPKNTKELKGRLEGLRKINKLFDEDNRLKIGEDCKPILENIRKDIKEASDKLDALYKAKIYSDTKDSLKEQLRSYAVQKDLVALQKSLGKQDDPLTDILAKLPKAVLDKLPHLEKVIAKKLFSDASKETEFRGILGDYVFQPAVTEARGTYLSVKLKAPTIALSALLKILKDIATPEDIAIEGEHVYFDTDLKDDSFKNKTITFNNKTIEIMPGNGYKIALPSSSINHPSAIQIFSTIKGKVKLNEKSMEWELSASKETASPFTWTW